MIRLCNFITALRLVFRSHFDISNTRKTGQHHLSHCIQIPIPTRTSLFSPFWHPIFSLVLDDFTIISSLNRSMPLFLPRHTCLAIRIGESRGAATRISVHCISTRPAIIAWFALTLICICNKTYLFQTRPFKIMQQTPVQIKHTVQNIGKYIGNSIWFHSWYHTKGVRVTLICNQYTYVIYQRDDHSLTYWTVRGNSN